MSLTPPPDLGLMRALPEVWRAALSYQHRSPRHLAYVAGFQAVWLAAHTATRAGQALDRRGQLGLPEAETPNCAPSPFVGDTAWARGPGALFGQTASTMNYAVGPPTCAPVGTPPGPLRAPVFIFANARSGTTFLQRLLNCDSERFVSLRLGESILPSRGMSRTILGAPGRSQMPHGEVAGAEGLGRRAALKAWLASRERALNQRLFGGWSDLHPMGLRDVEEDEALFVRLLATPTRYLLCPNPDFLPAWRSLDEQPRAYQDAVMAAYCASLRAVLPVAESRTLLVKNVLTASRFQALRRAFPDARFIYVARDPRASIPSFIRLFWRAWRAHSPRISLAGPEARGLADTGAFYYRKALADCATLPEPQLKLLTFNEVVADPLACVASIYRHFGWSLGASAQTRMRALAAQSRARRRPRPVTLQDVGLDERWLGRELGDVCERFAFLPEAGPGS